jgi:hypothetical protein
MPFRDESLSVFAIRGILRRFWLFASCQTDLTTDSRSWAYAEGRSLVRWCSSCSSTLV